MWTRLLFHLRLLVDLPMKPKVQKVFVSVDRSEDDQINIKDLEGYEVDESDSFFRGGAIQ